MGIFDDFKSKVSELQNIVQQFKENHIMANTIISKTIESFPPPFNTFGNILWDGLEKEDESAQKLLDVLQKIAEKQELDFMEITTQIKNLVKCNPSKQDILDIGKQIQESKSSIINILGAKIDDLKIDNDKSHSTTHKKLDEILSKLSISENTNLDEPLDNSLKITEKTKYFESSINKKDQKNMMYTYTMLQLGNIHHHNKEFKDAIEKYDAILHIDKSNVYAIANKGIALDELGNSKEAIACYDEAIKINPKHFGVHYNKGNSLGKLKRYEESIACYDEAIRLEPDDVNMYGNKGIALDELKRYEEAIACYDEAIRLEPDNLKVHISKYNALLQLGKYEDVVNVYNLIVKLANKNKSNSEK